MSGIATCFQCSQRYHCGDHPPADLWERFCGVCQWRAPWIDWEAIPTRSLAGEQKAEVGA